MFVFSHKDQFAKTLDVFAKILNEFAKTLDNSAKILDVFAKILNEFAKTLDEFAKTLDVSEYSEHSDTPTTKFLVLSSFINYVDYHGSTNQWCNCIQWDNSVLAWKEADQVTQKGNQ